MDGWYVMAADQLEQATTVGASGTVQRMEFGWLAAAALVLVGVAFFAIFVVPRVLDHALGILTIVGVIFFVGVALLTPKFLERSNLSQARSAVPVGEVELNQLTPTGFSVSWKTEVPVVSAVRYGLEAESLDLVQSDAKPTPKTVHEYRINGLMPGKKYYVKIISGGKEFPESKFLEVVLPTK